MSAELDRLLEPLDPPMAVVTAALPDGERAGCLVGFHCQASIEPVRYAVWLSKANHTFRVAVHSTHLGVHLLASTDADLAERFGTLSGDEADKFAGLEVDTAEGGVPMLPGCADRFLGRRTALLDEGGDHVCVVLEPVRAWSGTDHQPLRLAAVAHLDPGHGSDERDGPATGRAP